jgi:hypothetical protein
MEEYRGRVVLGVPEHQVRRELQEEVLYSHHKQEALHMLED